MAGIIATENNGICAQTQLFVNWLMALTCPQNATSPMPWALFTADAIAPVGDCRFTAWQQSHRGQILPALAGAMSGSGGATSCGGLAQCAAWAVEQRTGCLHCSVPTQNHERVLQLSPHGETTVPL